MRRALAEILGITLTMLIPITAGLGLYEYASRNQHDAFWRYTPGALMLYGRAPDANYRAAYQQAKASALAHSFVLDDPEIVQTNDLFNLWYRRWQSSYTIAVSRDARLLIIDGLWMVQFADDDLECIFAHEIGHLIEFQHNNDDHAVLRRLECLTAEQRADSLGRLLCGAERYDRILLKYVKTRPITRVVCSGATPVL